VRQKPIVPRQLAVQDVDDIIDYYLKEGSPDAASGFIDALEKAYDHIGRYPESGSSRLGAELTLPGLRFWSLKKYPHVVFYLERKDHVDVWRVLHSQRNIPESMRDPEVIW